MHNYTHRLKNYTKEDLEGKELYIIRQYSWQSKIEVKKLDVVKITDKTIMLYGGGRIPIEEVGLNKQYGRLVCPKEDIEYIVSEFKKAMNDMYQKEITRLQDEAIELNRASIEIVPSVLELQKMAEEKLSKGETNVPN